MNLPLTIGVELVTLNGSQDILEIESIELVVDSAVDIEMFLDTHMNL